MHLKGCIWGKKCQWPLYNSDLDCLALWAWASVTPNEPLLSGPAQRIRQSFSPCEQWRESSLNIAASLCGNGHARLPSYFTAPSSLHHFKDASVLHAAGKLACTVSKAVISALLLFWGGARFAPVNAGKPPANCFFLAARRRVPEPWPPFFSSLSWNQTCLLEIDLHSQETLKWLLKSFLVGTVTIFLIFFSLGIVVHGLRIF